jgi:hypothetical protein
MPLTKSFNDLVQNRAANDRDFVAALQHETDATPPLTMESMQHPGGDHAASDRT